MGDWKRKLIAAVRPHIERTNKRADANWDEIYSWLRARGMNKIYDITEPHHIIEFMELIDRLHDEDDASQPCAPPANPFIVERIEREIVRGATDLVTVKAVNRQLVNTKIVEGPYTPSQLRTLANQLTDLADAHEAVYPPTDDACTKAC